MKLLALSPDARLKCRPSCSKSRENATQGTKITPQVLNLSVWLLFATGSLCHSLNTALLVRHLQALTRAWGTSPMTPRAAHQLPVSSCRLWDPHIMPWLGAGNSSQGSPLPQACHPKSIATSTLDKWAPELGVGESLTLADSPTKCPGCCQSRTTMTTTAVIMPHSEMPWWVSVLFRPHGPWGGVRREAG